MRSPRPDHPAANRAGTIRTLAGLLAAGLFLGGTASVMLRTAGEWLEPIPAEAASSTAGRAVEAARKAGDKADEHVTQVEDAAAGRQPKPVDAKAVKKTAAAAPKPAAKAVAGPVPQTLTQVDEQVTYQYNALGRRDPFQSLVGDVYVGADVGGDAPPDLGALKVVGIVWGTSDRFAMVEDRRGNSLVLRKGDKEMNGVVEQLMREAIVVKHTVEGQTDWVTIPLTKKGDSNASH
jgi:type IV secretory pathway VirB10-like protein